MLPHASTTGDSCLLCFKVFWVWVREQPPHAHFTSPESELGRKQEPPSQGSSPKHAVKPYLPLLLGSVWAVTPMAQRPWAAPASHPVLGVNRFWASTEHLVTAALCFPGHWCTRK